MADRIKAYFMRVSEYGTVYKGYVGEIEDTLKAMQQYVRGGIEAVRLTEEIDVICHDEGKLKQFPPNRAWFYKGELVDIFCGNVLCVRHEGDAFASIREEDIPAILEHLRPIVKKDGVYYSPASNDKCPDWSGDEAY